jgi:hypothetical protein
MSEHVKTEIADGVLALTLRRLEKKNALSGAMYDALSEGLSGRRRTPLSRCFFRVTATVSQPETISRLCRRGDR